MSNKTQITDVTPEELTAKIVSSLEHTIQKIVKPNEEAPITLDELSSWTKHSKSALRKLIKDGVIPFERFGGKNSSYLFYLSKVKQALDSNNK